MTDTYSKKFCSMKVLFQHVHVGPHAIKWEEPTVVQGQAPQQ